MSTPRSPRKQVTSSTALGNKSFRIRLAGLAASAAVLLPHSGHGLTWDITPADGATITPGSGNWILDAGNWNNAGADVPWTNGGLAVFAGADAAPNSYNITVGSGLTAQSITFNNSGYILNAAAPTTLGLTTTSSINVAAGKSATIGSNLTLERGGEVSIVGGGTLKLAGTVQNTTTTNMAISGGTTVEVLAGGLLSSGASFVLGPVNGAASNGTLLVSGGTVRVTNNLVLGNVAGVTSYLKISDGLVALDRTTGNGIRFGPSGTLSSGAVTGTIDLDGGVLETRFIAEGPSSGAGTNTSTFNFNGGLLRATVTGNLMNGLDLANVKLGGARIETTSGLNATIPQVLSHDAGLGTTADGGLTKTGDGILTLTGANTFTGPVKILGGTISVTTLSASANPLGQSSNAPSNLLLDGGTFRFAGGGNLASDRGFTLGERGGTIEIAHSIGGVGFRFGGVVTGDGDLTITRGNNNGGLFFGLSNTNTYTGKTFVNNGVILEYRRAEAAGEGGSFESGTEVTGATVRLDPSGSGGAGGDQFYTEYFTLGEGGILENKSRSNTVFGEVALSGNARVTSVQQATSSTLKLEGKMTINDHTLTVSAGGLSGIEINGGISGGLSGSLAVTATGEGGYVIVSGGTNTYGGSTTLSGGELLVDGVLSNTSGITVSDGKLVLLGPDRINNAASLTMSGGVFETSGFSEDLGKFSLQGNAEIKLGSGSSVLRFLDSSDGAATWNGILSITDWKGSLSGGGVDQIFFGLDGAGLTSGQLAMIRFIDPLGFEPGTYFAGMLSTGEIVASTVPEPGTAMILLGGMGVLGLGRFRRRLSS